MCINRMVDIIRNNMPKYGNSCLSVYSLSRWWDSSVSGPENNNPRIAPFLPSPGLFPKYVPI